MTKVSGSYESVVRGVSQQVPQDRRSGQHWAQDNIISDPVRGAARRHGSVMQDEFVLGPDTLFSAALADTASHRSFTFYVDGQDYDIVVRTVAGDASTFAWAFHRGTRKFIPIVKAAGDAVLNQLVSGGLSAITSAGKYLLLAGNTVVPAWTSTKVWEGAANRQHSAVWVRGGAYARTFAITATMTNGIEYKAEYKTKSSSYPPLLDTSDIPATNENYQKLVNDRVYAYNSKATAWIGEAAEDITPQSIAAKLGAALTAAGLTGVTTQSGTVLIDNPGVASITADDGGDDSLIHAVAHEVKAPELVTTTHWVGKVVKVRPKRSNGDDAFYLEAVAQDAGATGWASVYWRECAGVVTQPTSAFVLATIKDGALYMASTKAGLQALTGIADVPGFEPSKVGDDITAPAPYFLGKRIDYLGMFQDRLVIGSGAVLLYSRPGDYFNWFRQSVLTIEDNDPVEQYALGSEDDVITASAAYDRNEIYFGRRYWYSVSGLQPLTPKTSGVVKLREEEGANGVPPVASGNLVFYCKQSGEEVSNRRRTKLHQIQAGLLADSPEGNDISAQLDDYLVGDGLEIVAYSAPNLVFLRTSGDRFTLYSYAYLDAEQGGQRLFDAWSRWTWNPKTGACVAVSQDGDELLVYMVRQGAGSTWIACERFSLQTTLSRRPYADSLRPLASAGGYFSPELDTLGCMAYGASHERPFVGVPFGQRATLTALYGTADAWVGIDYPARITPTNPYRRGQDGRSITSGRMTLAGVQITVADTGGMRVTTTAYGVTRVSRDFNGRILGSSQDVVGRQPIVSATIPALIGREIRECSYTIESVRWLPLTVTGIDWTGQYFNNTRRIS